MGVIEYSDTINVKIPLGTTNNPAQLKRLIDNIIPSQGTQRFTAKTLTKAAKDVYPASFNGRPGAHRVFVLITAGPSTDDERVGDATKDIGTAGVNVFVVDVKGGADGVKDIAPDSHVVSTKSIDDVPSAADILYRIIQKSVDESKLEKKSCIVVKH